MRNQKRIRICFLALFALLPACTGLEPAAIGVGVSAAQTGVTMLSGRTVRSYELARFEDVIAAAKRSAQSLDMELRRERTTDRRVLLDYRYSQSLGISVDVRRQTDTVTSILIRMRSKSQRGMAGLYLRDLFHELRDAGAYVEEWSGAAPPAVDLN